MKRLFYDCRLPLSGGSAFCTDGAFFARTATPFGERIGLHGAAVLPAFPDAHSHLLAYAVSLTQADGSGAGSARELIERAHRFARERGMHEHALVTIKNADRLPDPAALDACPRPLHVQMRSGHAGMLNAAARRMFAPESPAIMEERAYLMATRNIPLPDPAAMAEAFLRAQRRYLSYGITTAQEGLLTREMLPHYQRLSKSLLLDVIAYPAPDHFEEACALFPRLSAQRAPSPRASLTIGGIKIFLDGSPQQRTAFLRAPYVGGGMGRQEMTLREVTEACAFAAANGAQLLAHCNGDGAAEIFLRALSALSPARRRAIRPVLIHGQILGEDQLDRCKALGVIPSFFPAHIRDFGETHLRLLGRERGSRISPARSARDRGIPFTLHQDAPVFEPDPLDAVKCAVLRRTAAGTYLEGQEIGMRDALLAVTAHAAEQYGLCDRGRIAPGCRADFVVLDRDPLACPPEEYPLLHVTHTYRCGVCLFEQT